MKRREFLTMLGGATLMAPGLARAESGRTYHLGTVTPVAPISADSPNGKILLKALAERGYVLGQNLTLEARGAMGDVGKIQGILQAVEGPPGRCSRDRRISHGARRQVGRLTDRGAFGLGDPVETGLIKSQAHPGGNITGISDVAAILTTKRLSLLKELSPKLKKVAMLWNRDDLGMTLRYEASAKGAQAIGVEVEAVGVRAPEDFNEAFSVMSRDPPDAILMVADALTSLNRKRVFEFADTRKIPAIYEYDFLIRDGGLMSYGPDITESLERAAALVDRIFKGASPADLPFEQPTRYLFVLNLKTAKAAGFEIPPTLLALADEVIE